jgi:[acyl-carrier-protein] S-malonyltransferase
MLTPWLEQAGAVERLARWSDLTGLDLVRLGTTADADELRDTAITQPMLTAAALLSGQALLDAGVVPAVVAGHSIGEIPALAVAGVITDDAAMTLAAGRGSAMARAAAAAPTRLAAVLGGDRDEVVAAGEALGLQLATVNVPGQVVLGGPIDALDQLVAAPPAGARVRPLEVAGAFHTRAMEPAVEELAKLVADLQPSAPRAQVVANADGAVVADAQELVDRLIAQLTGPVRFDLCLETIAGLSPSGIVELAPGGTLAGMAKRAVPGVPIVALKSVDDLAAAVAL